MRHDWWTPSHVKYLWCVYVARCDIMSHRATYYVTWDDILCHTVWHNHYLAVIPVQWNKLFLCYSCEFFLNFWTGMLIQQLIFLLRQQFCLFCKKNHFSYTLNEFSVLKLNRLCSWSMLLLILWMLIYLSYSVFLLVGLKQNIIVCFLVYTSCRHSDFVMCISEYLTWLRQPVCIILKNYEQEFIMCRNII